MPTVKSTLTGSRIGGKQLGGNQVRDRRGNENLNVTKLATYLVLTSGSPAAPLTIKDALFSTETSQTVTTGLFNLSTTLPLDSGVTPTFASSNTAVATVSSSGAVTYVGQGTTLLTVSATGYSTYSVSMTVGETGDATTQTFENFVSGSLAAACCSAVDTAISGVTPSSTTQDIISNRNFLRTQGIDLTFMGTAGTPCGYPGSYVAGNCALISPSYILHANHFPQCYVQFTDNNGYDYYSYIEGNIEIGTSDILVGKLSTPMPSAITPVQLLPSNFRSYLPQVNYGVACCYTTRAKEVFVGEWNEDNLGSELFVGYPLVTGRQPFTQSLQGGDSSSPAFLIINGKPVLLTCWHTSGAFFGGVGGGPTYSDNLLAISAAMVGEMPSIIDLSAYPTY